MDDSLQMPRPASWSRLAVLAWIVAVHTTPFRVLAVAAWPTAFATLTVPMLRRTVYETTTTGGVVVFGRYRPLLDRVLHGVPSAAVTAVLLGGAFYARTLQPSVAVIVWMLLGVLFLGVLYMVRSSDYAPMGGYESPSGTPFALLEVASVDDDAESAVALAGRLIEQTPAGSVILARAGGSMPAQTLSSLGFEAGAGDRFHQRT